MNLDKGFHTNDIESIDFTDDSIKKNVSTAPLEPGGSNFKTHALVKKSASKLAYRPSAGSIRFSLIFLIIGLVVLFSGLFNFSSFSINFSQVNWFMVLFGVVFAGVGGFLSYTFFTPRVFDKQLGLYYKTYKVNIHKNRGDSKKQVLLKSIIALQIIGEQIRGKDRTYGSFELNIVLNNGSRENVIDHGNLKSIIDDAHVISNFLNIPIWHAKSSEDSISIY